MSALLILVIALVVLGLGYVFYGGWLAKQWGVDPNRETPAHTSYDGKDFVPANPAVLMGHHFSSIAGAGPINGPIQAAVFGWVPVFLWCVLGGIFFGAMHDFGALFASIRHNGGSIGEIIKDSMGVKAQRLFIVFALAVLILVIASFTSVVASTFEANYTGATYNDKGEKAAVSFKMEEKAFTEGEKMFAIVKTDYNKVGAAAEFNPNAVYYTAEYVPAEIDGFQEKVAYYVQGEDGKFTKINSSAVTFDPSTTYYNVQYNVAEITEFAKGTTYFTKTDTYALAEKAEEGKTYYTATAEENQFVKIGVNYKTIGQLTSNDKFTAVEGTVKAFVPVGSVITNNHVAANASTAMTSMLFILIAIIFGFFVYRKNAKVGPATIIGIIGIIAIVFIGLEVGLNMSRTFWVLFIAVYVMVASLLPVWILLQPRDYLSSFLLYGMMILAVVAIIGGTFTHTATMDVDAFTGWTNPAGQSLFPFLFITVACGACSGFHALISSGTSSKQISSEKDAQIVGYGSMIIESALGIISLIAVGVVFTKAQSGVNDMTMSSPPTIFAGGIATMFSSFAGGYDVIRNLFTLAVSVFALTSLDSATRLCRYLFVELLTPEGKQHGDLKGLAKIFSNPVVSTLLMVIIGCGIGFLNLNQIWGVFGAANQLLAGIAMLAVCTWLGKIGRNNKMFYFPMCFMLVATITALTITIIGKIKLIAGLVITDGVVSKAVWGDWFQMLWSIALVVMAVILVITGVKTLGKQAKEKAKKA